MYLLAGGLISDTELKSVGNGNFHPYEAAKPSLAPVPNFSNP